MFLVNLVHRLKSMAKTSRVFSRKFGYVDFASEEDLQKALELNGKNLMGQPVKLDRARTKENSKPRKTGNWSNLSYEHESDPLQKLWKLVSSLNSHVGWKIVNYWSRVICTIRWKIACVIVIYFLFGRVGDKMINIFIDGTLLSVTIEKCLIKHRSVKTHP